MKIEADKVLINIKELIGLHDRVSFSEKAAADLVMENLKLRNCAFVAERELKELENEQAKAVEILTVANANLSYVLKYLSKNAQDKYCSSCHERYCGNCSHANGAKVQ